MQKIKKKLLTLIVIISGIAMFIGSISISQNLKDEKTLQISLIVYDINSRNWDNLKQGAELACSGLNAEIRFCGIEAYNDAKEQIALIEREIADGADAILLAACDSKAIGEYLDNATLNIPVVLVQNGAETKKEYDCVTNNDYEMGQLLGKTITSNENKIVKVAIISDGLEKKEIEARKQGVLDEIDSHVSKILVWERDEDEKQLITRKFIQNHLLEEAVDVVVALDNSASVALMDALINLNRSTKVYMISTADESVYYLDRGKVKALLYSSDFDIGYEGAKYILDGKKAKKQFENIDIKYQIISKENMYDEDVQTFIFPFVK